MKQLTIQELYDKLDEILKNNPSASRGIIETTPDEFQQYLKLNDITYDKYSNILNLDFIL